MQTKNLFSYHIIAAATRLLLATLSEFVSTERIDKKYGNKAKFEEAYKVGNDGVTTVKYKVNLL